MNVFIDTSILINMYELSGPDLDELKKMVELVRAERIKILMTQQVEDEFWRNREGSVAEAVKRFKETKVNLVQPNLIRMYDGANDLRNAVKAIDKMVKEIITVVEADIQNDSLKADEVIKELFLLATPESLDGSIIEEARLRVELGNPPGKRGGLGDAVNWEWLLNHAPNGEKLIIVSIDGDFESVLVQEKVKEYLFREWKKRKGAEIDLYKSLPKFLKDHFPDIKLSDEIAKLTAIERLEWSDSFAETHEVIARLSKFDDFNDNEVEKILEAYLSNSQILRIINDEDVKEFARKVTGLVTTEYTQKLANEVKSQIREDKPIEELKVDW